MTTSYVQALTQYLAGSGVTVGATSIVLQSLTDIYGNAITTITPFGTVGYITLEPDSTNEEAAIFTGVTANANGTVTLTGVSTVIAQTPYTATSGLVRAHAGGTKLVITDNVKFWSTFANKQNDEVLTGRFSTTVTPLNANDLVPKSYADGLAIAGAPDSSTTVKGIVKMSVAPSSPTSPIAVGDNDPRMTLGTKSGTAYNSSTNKLEDEADTGTSGANKLLRLDANGNIGVKTQLFESFPRGETVNGATTPVPVVLIDDTFQEEFGGAVTIAFGKVSTGNKASLGFKLQKQITLTTLKVYLKKTGSPTDNAIFTIETDNAGAPSGTPVTNATGNAIAGTGLTSSFVLTTVTMGGTVTLVANTQYWLVAKRDSTTSDTNYYNLDGIVTANKYASFTGSTNNASSWSTGADVPYVQLICVTGDSQSIWRCSTNHANYHIRLGVGIVNTDGAISVTNNVIFRGGVTGFTGLTPMAIYYAQDTIGTLGITSGTTETIIGTAISSTEIFVGMGNDSQQYIGSEVLSSSPSTIGLMFQKRARFARVVITGSPTGQDGFSSMTFFLHRDGVSSSIGISQLAGTAKTASVSAVWSGNVITWSSTATDGVTGTAATAYYYR